jgi:predicted enzyme related to lactoylglutathione lyase
MLNTSRKLFALLALGALAVTAAAADAVVRSPGKFTWFNLATPDAAVAQSFYGAVFGWEFAPAPTGDRYTVIRHGGRDIGAIVVPADPTKAKGARWISLLSVADAAAAVDQAKQHGGTVLIPPTSVAQRGTHALLRDADGALFGLLQSAAADPGDELAANDFFWTDLLTREPAKAAEFYRAVAGYEVSQEHLGAGIDRVVLSSGGAKRAGSAPMPKDLKQPGWLPYVVVDDVPATVALVTKAGGRVLLAPSADLLDGQLAVFADPAGGVLGLVKWSPSTSN